MKIAYLTLFSGMMPGRLGDPKSSDLHQDNPADWMSKYHMLPDQMMES